MTRQATPPRPGDRVRPGGRASRDPYGILPPSASLAPILSAVGLAVVAMLTLGLFTGRLPFVPSGGGGGGAGGGGVVDRTPAPSNVVVVDPRADVPGSLVYVKQGNIWIQSGTDAHQLTNTGNDSMPTWSADGQWVYFVETRTERGLFPSGGAASYYDLTYPIVTRIHPDGSGREEIATGKYTTSGGRYQWFYWLRQPVPDPSGKTLAVMSDAPDPTKSDVVLQLMDIATGKMTDLGTPESAPLGQQDPAWRPVGRQQLLYVMNGRDGPRGAPSIWRYDPLTKKARAFTGPGYLAPAWSPDGGYVAATKTSSLGTDVVVLDLKTGSEVLRVTDDGRSWGAVWSPAGDAIAYLHMDGGIVDLRMVKLVGSGPTWTLGDSIDVTQYSGLDGGSRPSWYIPPDQMPARTPAPASPSSSGASGAPASPSTP